MVPPSLLLMILGHLGKESQLYISSLTMTSLLLAVLISTVINGLGSALDTMCSQAYGAKKLQDIGVFFQTSMIIMLVTCLPVFLTCFYANELFLLLGQQADVAQLAARSIILIAPAYPFAYVGDALNRILVTQNIVTPLIYVSISSNLVQLAVAYVLVLHTSLGYYGVIISLSLQLIVQPFFLVPYFVKSHLYQNEWPGWKLKQALAEVPEFLKLGLSGTIVTFSQLLSMESSSLLAGNMINPLQAINTNAIFIQSRSYFSLAYESVCRGGITRIGNALGSEDIIRAKAATISTTVIQLILSLAFGAILFIFPGFFPHLFTDNAEIQDDTSFLIRTTAVFQICTGLFSACKAFLIAAGKQNLCAMLNFLAYGLIGVPLGCVFAFPLKLRIFGLWYGMSIGLFVALVVSVFIVRRLSWKKLSDEAQERLDAVQS